MLTQPKEQYSPGRFPLRPGLEANLRDASINARGAAEGINGHPEGF